jgi:acyl-CoA synthetase (AMP-forming)/AMP-acid ligase II
VFARLDAGETVALGPLESRGASAECPSPIPAGKDPWIGLTSSGSTGRPKLVWRSWKQLRNEAVTSEGLQGWTWASPFLPHTYAGVAVALQAWMNDGRVLPLGAPNETAWIALARRSVDALSCTPTYADLLLQHEPATGSRWSPRQATLGGEALRPATGQRLARRFPQSRFTAIYATAEHGVLLKSHRLDGWYEAKPPDHRASPWRVRAGAIEVRRNGTWVATGDEAELKGRLVRVIGRLDGVANVAGTKVNLAEVGRIAETVSGVRRAVAVAEPSPITGQVVCLHFAVETGWNSREVTHRLQAHLRTSLAREAWPRRWERSEVGLGPNAKRSVSGG